MSDDTVILNTLLNFRLKYRGKNKHNVERYDVYLKISKDYILFGRCFITKKTSKNALSSVEVFPSVSFYNRDNDYCDTSEIDSIAKQIAELIYDSETNF